MAYAAEVTTSVLVLGAGFGGLELAARLSEELGDEAGVTLIDRSDAFVFGFSKLDVLFGRQGPDAVRLPYADIASPGVRFEQAAITAIDPEARRVETDAGTFEADVVVVALGADLDPDATPGLTEAGNEFYSVPGAEAARETLSRFDGGTAIVGICGAPYKCPPAPSEAALLLDEHLRERGIRERSRIALASPFGTPVPPSPATSETILGRFTERGIDFVADRKVGALDPATYEAVLDDGTRLPYDLFLGVPVHRAPAVVEPMTEEGWIPVDQATLATPFPGVYAVGDVTSVGTPKAGTFSEGAARVVADQLVARIRGEAEPPGFDGTGACWMEFGDHEVGRIDVDFFTTPGSPIGTLVGPSTALAVEKAAFGATRRARWFGGPARSAPR